MSRSKTSKRRKTKSVVNVSDLAYYISNPDLYVRKKGKPWNESMATFGSNYHAAIGRKKPHQQQLLWIIIVCLILATYMGLHFLTS